MSKAPRDEEFYLDIIEKWQQNWMNQKQNSEADYKNYLHRAIGIDANMRYSLADRLVKAWEVTAPLTDDEAIYNWIEKEAIRYVNYPNAIDFRQHSYRLMNICRDEYTAKAKREMARECVEFLRYGSNHHAADALEKHLKDLGVL